MRIRQIKPSWFLDKELRRGVTADAREFYIGLWMIADDAGWFAWDVERIAAELYPYDTPIRRREGNVQKWAEVLERLNDESPHLVIYSCGHALVPKMAGHQRNAGKVSVGTRDKHREVCRDVVSRIRLTVAITPSEPLEATDSQSSLRKEVGKEERGKRNGTERNGSSPAGAQDAPRTEFQEKVPRPLIVVTK